MRRLFKIQTLVVASLCLMVFVAYGIWEFRRTITVAEEQATAITQTILKLERSIGYVGLIHNFKNAVLRPSEPRYIDDAENDYREATGHIDRLAAQLAESEVELDLTPLREAIDSYGAALAVLRTSQGLSIPETDRLVRIPDEQALINLVAMEEEISTLLQVRKENLLRWATRSTAVLFVLMFGIFAMAALSVRLQRQKQQREYDLQHIELEREQAHSIEREKILKELERSNHELDEFAYIASHDLKEPLRGIRINANFLLREELPGKAGERATRMSELAGRMEQLITDLLYFSRLGQNETPREQVEPRHVIANIRSDLAEWLSEHNGEIIEVNSIPTLLAEPLKIKTVIQNLIVNGIKYNDSEKKWVEVGFAPVAEVNGQTLENAIFVKDNGIGIAEEYREKTFRIFSRLNKQSEYGYGSGSGLAFVRKIVLLNDGVVDFVSEPGKGTTFFVTLPLAQKKPYKKAEGMAQAHES